MVEAALVRLSEDGVIWYLGLWEEGAFLHLWVVLVYVWWDENGS